MSRARSASPIFTGLSAFPLTPASPDGIVDVVTLGTLLGRLCAAEVDSIGLLGSTGAYAYLDRPQRRRAVEAAVEAVAGRVPLIVGVGALRTDWAQELARGAERAGADGLLLAPISYTPLTPAEVAGHYRAVAGATGLPLCIYNNPGTTHFTFSLDLLAEIADTPRVAAVKMPLPADGDVAGEIARLRARAKSDFAIGYSGDWGAGASLLAGADAFYSVLAGVLPRPMLKLARAARAGRPEELQALEDVLAPMWRLFRAHGGLRITYALADLLALPVGDPPAPIKRIGREVVGEVEEALRRLDGLSMLDRAGLRADLTSLG